MKRSRGEKRPNIILCVCDQLRAFETGCYGNPLIRTPNIDRLSHEGVRFEHGISNYPLCMPARSVLLSGQYNRSCTGGAANVSFPGRPGDFNLPEYPYAGRPHLPDPTLAELLRGAGYETRAIGKWHIHSWPHELGFEHYLIPRVHHAHTAQLFSEDGGREFAAPGYSVDFEAGRVVDFIKARARQRGSAGENRPFFLYYCISPPHNPLADAPEKYLSMYAPGEIPLRPNLDPAARLPDQDYWFRVYRWDYRYYSLGLPFAGELPANYDLRRLIAEYYGLTSWVDDALGRVLNALDMSGLDEDTLVVFTSDHGDNLGSHGLVQKGTPNQEAVRIPFIIRPPHGIGGKVVGEAAAGLVDVAPTLLSLAGIERPPHFQGKDLSPLFVGGAPGSDENWTVIETPRGAGLRTPERLYFLPWEADSASRPGRRLAASPLFHFDLAADPFELRNLAPGRAAWSDAGGGAASHPAGVPESTAELDRLLRTWDERTPWMAGS